MFQKSCFGDVSQACTIKLRQSQNGTIWYDTGISYTTTGASNWYMSLNDAGAKWYQLQYSASGTIAGKQ